MLVETPIHRILPPRSRGGGAVDSQELAIGIGGSSEQRVDPLRLPRKIRVERAENDSGMARVRPVKPFEIEAVQGQQDPRVLRRVLQHIDVGNSLAVFSGIACGLDIVAQFAERLDHGQRKILVALDLCHARRPITPLPPHTPGVLTMLGTAPERCCSRS